MKRLDVTLLIALTTLAVEQEKTGERASKRGKTRSKTYLVVMKLSGVQDGNITVT